MIKKRNKANIFLLCVFSLSFLFYSYSVLTNKGAIKLKKNEDLKDVINLNSGVTKFSDVEYKSTSRNNKDFITRGKEAYISTDQPNLINIDDVHSFTKLNDGTVLDIRSDKAKYFKATKNIQYYENVIIKNKDGIIKAENANFYANKNLIKLEKATYKDGQNLITSDIVMLNTLTNNIELLMKEKKDRVYGQRKQK